jgi:hypothetical protein
MNCQRKREANRRKKKKFIRYLNKKYNYTLQLPTWWSSHVYVNCLHRTKDAESSTNFYLKYSKKIKGKCSTIIFSILVFRMPYSKWKNKYKDSPLQFLASKEGKVFAFITPSQPPEELLNKDRMAYNHKLVEFKALVRMVNDDVPIIIKSLKFNKGKQRN